MPIVILLSLLACFIPGQAYADTKSQECLALAMYWEARGEGDRGMQAVGFVIKNRAADTRFPDSTCAVVFQGGEAPPCQFSWWCDGKSDRPTNMDAWREAKKLASDILTGRQRDPTGGALYFHSVDVNPKWRLRRTKRIGNHIFYR